MEINPEILTILEGNNVDKNIGLMYLLSLYHKIDAESIIPDHVKKQVYAAKVVTRDYEATTIIWNIPLFNGQEIAFKWCEDWAEAFGKINKDRRGDTKAVISRMKQFFAGNPEVRKEDVYAARDLYLRSVVDPTYLKMSHKFIFEGNGKIKTSMLRMYTEQVMKNKQASIAGNRAGKIM